jgi:hypothetical protein
LPAPITGTVVNDPTPQPLNGQAAPTDPVPDAPNGSAMGGSSVTLGTFRGEYDSEAVYVYGDLVFAGGSTWLCTVNGVATAPPVGWQLVAAEGAQGPTGPAGADGATGPQGPQGIQGPPGSDAPSTLDALGDPLNDTEFTFAGKKMSWQFTNPVDYGFQIHGTDSFSGDLLHVHQHSGNPTAGTDLVHVEFTDADVTGLRITGPSSTAQAATILGKVDVDGTIAATTQIKIGTSASTAPFVIYKDGIANVGSFLLDQPTVPTGSTNTGPHFFFKSGGIDRGWFGFFDSSAHGSGTQLNLRGAGGVRIGASVGGTPDLTITTGTVQAGTLTSSATATPFSINLGGTYADTAGTASKAKLKLYSDGSIHYGIGVSSQSIDYMADTNAAHNFYTGSTKRLQMLTPVDGSSAIANILNSGRNYAINGAKLLSVQNNSVEKFYVDYAGVGNFTGSVISSGNFLTDGAFTTITAKPVTVKGWAPEGSSAVGVILDNGTTLSHASAKLLSVRNNNTEKAYVDASGAGWFGGQLTATSTLWAGNGVYASGAATWSLTNYSAGTLKLGGTVGDGTSAVSIVLDHNGTALAGSGAKIVSIRNAGAEKAYFDKEGRLSTPSLIGTPVTVSNVSAVGTPSATTYLRGDGSWATPSGGTGGTTVVNVDLDNPIRFAGTAVNRAKGILMRAVLRSSHYVFSTPMWDPGSTYSAYFFLRDLYMAAAALPGYFDSARLTPGLNQFFASIGGDGVGPAQAAQHFTISNLTASYREGSNNVGYRPTYDTAAYMILTAGQVYRRGDKTIFNTRKAALQAMFEETPRASSGLLYSNPTEQNCGWGFESGNNLYGELGMASALYAQAAREMVYMATEQGDSTVAAAFQAHYDALVAGLRTLRRSDGLYKPNDLADLRHSILSSLMVSEGLILDPAEREQTARALRDGVLTGQVCSVAGGVRHLFVGEYFPGAGNSPGDTQNGAYWHGQWTGWLAKAMVVAGDPDLGLRILQSACDKFNEIQDSGNPTAPWEIHNFDGSAHWYNAAYSMAAGGFLECIDDVEAAGSYKLDSTGTPLSPVGFSINNAYGTGYISEESYTGLTGTVDLYGPDGTLVTSLSTSTPVIVVDVAAQNVAIDDVLTSPPPATGGGAAPGGSDTEFQFKSGTAFSATSNVRWDATNSTLLVGPGATSAANVDLSVTSNDTTNFWTGRIVAGGAPSNPNGVAFLMGQIQASPTDYRAWLGAHNSALSAWADLWINPDGGAAVRIGADGGGNSLLVLNNGTATSTFSGTVIVPDASFTVAKLSATGTPSASTYLRGDGAWATPSGGGSPGGSSESIQYNDGAGGFAGNTSLKYDAAKNHLEVLGTNPAVCLGNISAEPTPEAGELIVYAKIVAGRWLPKFMGPVGVDNAFQPQLWGNRIIHWFPATSTSIGNIGMTPTTAATLSHPTPAMTNLGTSLDRVQFATSTTAGNAAGARAPRNTLYGGNASTPGGWFFHCRFNQGSLHTNGVQKMVGVSSSTAALAGEPSSSMNDFCGMCLDSGDTQWQFTRRTGSGTATKVSLGVTPAADQVFDLTMYVKPGTTELFVRCTQYANSGAGTVLLDTSYTTSVPAATTLLGPHFQVRNGALAAAHNMALARLYIESDY